MTNTKSDLQVLSLNIYHGQMPRELMAYIMSKTDDVSVFCFQETDAVARKLLDSILLGNFEGYHALKVSGDDDFDISIYVRRDIEVVDVSTVYADVDMAGLALRAKLIDDKGSRLNVSSVYGTPLPGHKLDTPERLGLSRELVEVALGSGQVEVMVGDFNLLPEAESVKMFAANGMHDLIAEFDIPTTRNEIAWSKFPAHMKQLYADFAFVSGKSVEYDFTVEDVRASDHLPLIIDVSLVSRQITESSEQLVSSTV